MGALTTTTGTRLPDTMADRSEGDPIPQHVGDYVAEEFVVPVLTTYDGGRPLSPHELRMLSARLRALLRRIHAAGLPARSGS